MAKRVLHLSETGRFARFATFGLLGLMAGLGHAPIDMWYLTVLAFGVMFWLVQADTAPRRLAFHVWAFGFGYFGFSLRWIIEPFMVDIARHGWMAPFALVLMAAGGALFWALAGWLAARLAARNMLMLALLLVAVEMLRSWILTGFPWALLGHVWISTHLAQVAAFGGPHLLTLVTLMAGLSVSSLAGIRRIYGLLCLGGLAAFSFLLQPKPPSQISGDLPVIRLVQPNAPQQQKWDPQYRDIFLNRMIRMTGGGDIPDLVVWPETAVPYLLNFVEDDVSVISDAARGAPLVFGIQRRDAAQNAYNSLVVMGPGGALQSIYDKRHLVPFGEYVPGARLLGQLGAPGLAGNLATGFTPGKTPGPLDLPGIGMALPLICYEGIFAEEIHYGDARPRLLLLITNDAWFGQAAGPHQHLAQARLRAIEHGLPMVRVANTGISAMIDGRGRITDAIPLGIDGFIDASLPPALSPTIYSRYGEWPFSAVLFLLILSVYFARRHDSD